MKKTLGTVLAITILAVAMFGAVGSAYAMADTGKGPGNNGNSGAGKSTTTAGENSTSVLSAYMTDAMATVLELDPVALTARLDAGETFYDIALAEGYTAEEWAVLFSTAQASATEAAAADGLTPQIQTQLNTNTAAQLNTNAATQSQLNDGTCDGTGDCLQTDPVPNLYTGANAGTGGRRGGRQTINKLKKKQSCNRNSVFVFKGKSSGKKL